MSNPFITLDEISSYILKICKEEVKKSLFDRLVDKYNNVNDESKTKEENLEENAGLYHRKEQEDSTAHILNKNEEKQNNN